MNKIAKFFDKWAFAIVLGVIAIALLFALGCTIYTATVNTFVGIVGTIGVAIALACVVGWICTEVRDIKYFDKL